MTAPRTRPGGGQLTGNPTDLALENRELHRLRAQRVEALALIDELMCRAQNHGLDRTGWTAGVSWRADVWSLLVERRAALEAGATHQQRHLTLNAAAVPDVVCGTAVLPTGGAVEPRTGRDRPHAGS